MDEHSDIVVTIGDQRIIMEDSWWPDDTTFCVLEKGTGKIFTFTGCWPMSIMYNLPLKYDTLDYCTFIGANKTWEPSNHD